MWVKRATLVLISLGFAAVSGQAFAEPIELYQNIYTPREWTKPAVENSQVLDLTQYYRGFASAWTFEFPRVEFAQTGNVKPAADARTGTVTVAVK